MGQLGNIYVWTPKSWEKIFHDRLDDSAKETSRNREHKTPFQAIQGGCSVKVLTPKRESTWLNPELKLDFFLSVDSTALKLQPPGAFFLELKTVI